MRPSFLFSTCLLAALFVDCFAAGLLKSKIGGSRKHKIMAATPVDKADGWTRLESDGNNEKGPSEQPVGDTNGQPVVANPPEAGAYGTQNTYGAGAAYGYNPALYGNPYSLSNGPQFAPNNYLYSGPMNPCNCPQGNNQLANGGGSYNQNLNQGPKPPLSRNQDAVARQGYQYQGFPRYAQYRPYNAVQYPMLPYAAMPVGYPYQQNINRYPYNPYYAQQRPYYAQQRPYYPQQRQLVVRNNRQGKHQRQAQKQRGENSRDKIRQKDRNMKRKQHH